MRSFVIFCRHSFIIFNHSEAKSNLGEQSKEPRERRKSSKWPLSRSSNRVGQHGTILILKGQTSITKG